MDLTFYSLDSTNKIVIRPGSVTRAWMDESQNPYKCLPLTAANGLGWDFVLAEDVNIYWNGNEDLDALTIEADQTKDNPFVDSNFAHGIVTFNLGYLIRTSEYWQLLVTGPPNVVYDNFFPLTGVVETDWFSYPFTMNWKVMDIGTVTLKKGDSICRVIPIQVKPILTSEPSISPISKNTLISEQVKSYAMDRRNQRANEGEFHTGMYMKGKCPMQEAPEGRHWTKIQVKEPKRSA